MVLTHDKKVFLKEYSKALRDGAAALFVGAGVSRSAGYVNWRDLLRGIAEELELDADLESDLPSLAQFHVNSSTTRARLDQLLIDEFLEDVEQTPSHKLIASLPIDTVWTTNYDDLLETAFDAAAKRTDVKRRQQDFSYTRSRRDVTIYKMHGDHTAPSEAVLTKEDYETYLNKRSLFTTALKGDLAQKTFLFLGVSFTDPNLAYVLSHVRHLLEENSREHYCVLKRVPDQETGHEAKRFRHWVNDLGRYSIKPVLIDEYDEVPQLLDELNRRSHIRNIFISGSAEDFSPLGEDRFQELCRELGAELIRRKFNVVSGFGQGVGDSVIVGAMHQLRKNDDERLRLWPFPQSTVPGENLSTLWHLYRERMISEAGICIVLAGNKLEGNAVVAAEGVREEVGIAESRGLKILPIGATGHVARELWEQMRSNPSKFVGDTNLGASVEILGDSSADVSQIVAATIASIESMEQ